LVAAQKLLPSAPWAAAQRLAVPVAAAREAFRCQRLPASVGPMAAEKFLSLQPG
jgi:hypothetical protein